MLRSARMIFLIVLVLLSSGCEKKGSGEAEFEQAARVVETMLEPKNIKATVFVSLYPEKSRRISLNFFLPRMPRLFGLRQNRKVKMCIMPTGAQNYQITLAFLKKPRMISLANNL